MAVTFDPILGKLRKRDVSTGGSATWGNIVGTLSDQTDLQNVLDVKVNDTGDTMTGDLVMDNASITGVETLGFDILYTKTGSEPIGSIYWNEVDGTVDMRLKNGATLQTGQELHFYGKASGDILNGELCQFAGVQGDHILIKKVVASEIIAFPQYLVGVATQGIANGDYGYVTWFGKVNGVYTDTPNNNDSVDWTAGDILYFNNSTGQLTKTQPSAPNRNIIVAAVIREQTGASETGIILVRPTFGSKLADCDDVDGASPDATGDLLSWNNTSQTWERNAYNITNYALQATINTEHTDTLGPQGFIPEQDWNKATVSVSTTKLQIVVTSPTNIAYYWRGNKTDLGSTTLTVTSTIDKAEGIWYCYSTDGTNFVLNQTPFYIYDHIAGTMRADLMVWEFYWDNTNNTTLWIQPEFHTNQLLPGNHGYLHEAYGTKYSNGLDITYGTTASNADTRLKITSGEIHDEDISAYLTHSATPTAIWEQILGSAGTADANYAALPIYYLSGATPVWRKTTTSSYPFLPVSNNYIYYNRNNAGTWDYATSLGTADFVVYWIIGTTNQSEPIVVIPGRIDHASLTAAQAESFPNLSGLFTEYKLLYRIIYQTSAANSNNGKCRINSIVDYRRDAIANNSSATSTPSAALVSFTPTSTITATNVQAAIEEVDNEKLPLTKVAVSTAVMTELATGFTLAGGTTSKTLTVALDANVAGTNTGDVTLATNHGLSLTGQVIGMGTPSDIGPATTNSVTTTTHTHAISGFQLAFTWNDVTGTTQAMTVNNGYLADNASLVTLTLPSTAAFGTIIEVAGAGDGGWKVAQNSGQIIRFGNASTTLGTGGYLASTHTRDSIKLLCVTANTSFQVISSIGNITYV